MIAYHPVYPGDEGSPLEKDIDETDRLELAYGQNTFSLDVASINYDNPVILTRTAPLFMITIDFP